MSSTAVRSSSKLRPHSYCPKCRRASVVRSAKRTDAAVRGLRLWSLTERCIMCEWEQTFKFVKMGA